MLNTAQGILIGIRRCDSEAAFNELLGAAQRNRVPVFAMAWALVHLASHGDKTTESCSARTAARREWGRLFAASAKSTAWALIRELPSTEHHLGCADRHLDVAGQVTHCDFWFPDVEVPVGFGQMRTGKQLPVLTMVCGHDVGTAWTYVTGIDLPAQCSTELQRWTG
jgi:hypothetical protein